MSPFGLSARVEATYLFFSHVFSHFDYLASLFGHFELLLCPIWVSVFLVLAFLHVSVALLCLFVVILSLHMAILSFQASLLSHFVPCCGSFASFHGCFCHNLITSCLTYTVLRHILVI